MLSSSDKKTFFIFPINVFTLLEYCDFFMSTFLNQSPFVHSSITNDLASSGKSISKNISCTSVTLIFIYLVVSSFHLLADSTVNTDSFLLSLL